MIKPAVQEQVLSRQQVFAEGYLVLLVFFFSFD